MLRTALLMNAPYVGRLANVQDVPSVTIFGGKLNVLMVGVLTGSKEEKRDMMLTVLVDDRTQ